MLIMHERAGLWRITFWGGEDAMGEGTLRPILVAGPGSGIGKVIARRLAAPSVVAAVVEFLAGPGASYVTNQVIHVNGGRC